MAAAPVPTDRASAQARHDELSRTVRDARYRYYVLSDLAMPDAAFDERLQELEAIEAAFPDLIRGGRQRGVERRVWLFPA